MWSPAPSRAAFTRRPHCPSPPRCRPGKTGSGSNGILAIVPAKESTAGRQPSYRLCVRRSPKPMSWPRLKPPGPDAESSARCTLQRLQQRIGARSGGAGTARSVRLGDVMMVVTALPLQRRCHFVEADRTVAILVQLAEHVVGLRGVGAAGAEAVFKFRFADLAVAIGIELREQILQGIGLAGRCGGG